MGTMPAGGLIPSGIGGCLVAGELGADLTTPDCTEAKGSIENGLLDVGRWQLQELFLTGECPHSGTMGAISRRRVGYDFRYSCEIPYDYNNPADELLAGATTIALRLNLADVTQEPLIGRQQRTAAVLHRPLVHFRSGDSRARCGGGRDPHDLPWQWQWIDLLVPGRPRLLQELRELHAVAGVERMNKTITLTIDGQPRELKADYLNPAALEYWRAWLAHEARMAHNPFSEFAAKVQALPDDLRAVATREFVAGVNFDVVPKLVLLKPSGRCRP